MLLISGPIPSMIFSITELAAQESEV